LVIQYNSSTYEMLHKTVVIIQVKYAFRYTQRLSMHSTVCEELNDDDDDNGSLVSKSQRPFKSFP